MNSDQQGCRMLFEKDGHQKDMLCDCCDFEITPADCLIFRITHLAFRKSYTPSECRKIIEDLRPIVHLKKMKRSISEEVELYKNKDFAIRVNFPKYQCRSLKSVVFNLGMLFNSPAMYFSLIKHYTIKNIFKMIGEISLRWVISQNLIKRFISDMIYRVSQILRRRILLEFGKEIDLEIRGNCARSCDFFKFYINRMKWLETGREEGDDE